MNCNKVQIAKIQSINEAHKAKLKWRSIRRSLLEVDIYLSKFIDENGLDNLTEEEIIAYEQLLEYDDASLLLLLQKKVIDNNLLRQNVIDKITVEFLKGSENE